MERLQDGFAALPKGKAGTRLPELQGLADLLVVDGPIGGVAASVLGRSARPVRAIYFDKSPDGNWALDWHQDRVICVEARTDAPGFDAWTLKSGLIHVSPPTEILDRMVTLRVHLDDVAADNSPLLIAPASHRLGRVSEKDIQSAVAKCGTSTCLAEAGDVWLYATLILHASERAVRPHRRRVLQLDYAAFDLPYGLAWRKLV